MAHSAFVQTTTRWLDLHGEWEGQRIEVKEHLGVADQRRIDGSGFTSLRGVAAGKPAEEVEANIDMANMYMTQLKVYLVGWEGESFRDAEGKPVAVTPTAIAMLKPECADEMMDRLREWLAEVRSAREANPTSTTRSEPRSA